MFCKKNEAQSFTIPGETNGRIYTSSPKGDQTVAYVETNGVYPESGYSINEVCTETIYLIEGSFEIEVNDEKYKMEPGDLYSILPKNKYRISGHGRALDFISPAWDKSQNKIIK